MGKVENIPSALFAVGQRLTSLPRQVTTDKMIEFEKVVWDRGQNSHTDLTAAQRDGLTKTIASGQNQMAFLHELMERNFGDSWVYGGEISVRYIYPVASGDTLTPQAVVTEVCNVGGQQRVKLEIWCENQNGQKTSAGTASARQPSGSRTWLNNEGSKTS